jgi:hypothetical protein
MYTSNLAEIPQNLILFYVYRHLVDEGSRSTYNYNCINRIKLESRSRWRAIAIGEWTPEYPSVRCYMYMYMIAQPENPTFFSDVWSNKG